MTGPAVIAHRGASAHAPENTLAAFRLAAELGASSIESDLRCTREGRFVLLHDARVNRTTSGHGPVAQIGLDALCRLDAGSWFDGRSFGEHVPTLEEGLALAEELDLGVYLELKIPLDTALCHSLARTLRRFPLDRIVVLSFQPSALLSIQAAEPRLKTAVLVRRAGLALEAVDRAGTQLLALHRRSTSRRLVAQAHRAGIGVVTWTVNGSREMRKMIDIGVDGIMTDRPDRLINILRHKGLAAGPSKPAALVSQVEYP